jgi:PAS domain S-box-containing protein
MINEINDYLQPSYDYHLVILSVVIAVISCYIGLDLIARINKYSGIKRQLYLVGSSLILGMGILIMRFIGMKAYQLPIIRTYDLPLIIIGASSAIVASWVAILIISFQQVSKINLLVGSLIMGFGFGIMHYSSMLAMKLPAIAIYHPTLVIISLVIVSCANFLALKATLNPGQSDNFLSFYKLRNAVFMGNAIACMHYIGLASVSWRTNKINSIDITKIDESMLGLIIAITTFMILTLALLLSFFSQRINLQNQQIIANKEKQYLSERYQLLLEKSRDILILFNHELQIIDANNTAVQTYGYSKEELLKLKLYDLKIEKSEQIIKQLITQLEDNPVFLETTHLRQDGTILPVEVSWQSVIIGDEKIYLSIIRDITQRKEAEREQRKQQTAIRALYKFTTRKYLPIEYRINTLLAIGCRFLGLDMGALGEIKDNKYYTLATYSLPNIENLLHKGDIFLLPQTYCGQTFFNRQLTWIENASKSAIWANNAMYQLNKIEAYIGMPLFVKGQIYGTICFFSQTPKNQLFTATEKDILKLIAQGISAEIERQQRELELEQSKNRLTLINQIATSITLGDTIDKIISNTVKHISQYFPDLRVAYAQIKQGKFMFVYSEQPENMSLLTECESKVTNIDEYLQMLHQKKYIVINDINQEPKLAPILQELIHYQKQAMIQVPLYHSERLVGLLCLQSPIPKNWSDYEINTMIEIAEYLSLALKQDYTQQKREHAVEALKLSENRFRNLVETSSDLVWEIDENYIYKYVSPKIVDILGYQPQEILGKKSFDPLSIHSERPQPFYCLETTQIHKHGYIIVLESSGVPIWDSQGKFIGYNGISRDITERKKIETEMRKSIEKEKELAELKSRFVTMASHEFRTPLATILASSDLIKRYGEKLTFEKKINHLDKIQRQVRKMTQLLEDVLTIGKVNAGKVEFKPDCLDLEYLCEDIMSDIKLIYGENYQFNLSYEGELKKIYADEKLLRHILSNLVSNAAKYSSQKKQIDFEIICEANQAIFKVRDYGIGIPEADQKHLFESFHRAQNVGNISGTGLGLAIVKKAVEMHGGKINFISQVGTGTTFTVIIPIKTD